MIEHKRQQTGLFGLSALAIAVAVAGCDNDTPETKADSGIMGGTATPGDTGTPATDTGTPATDTNPDADADADSPDGTMGVQDEDDDGPDGPPIKLDTNALPDAAGGGHCPVITVESEPMVVPADIIIAVDTSGSMTEEVAAVQANLNSFSQQIVDAGVDAVVVLIANGFGQFDICIDPPLGGGGCPATDDNEPTFLHVDTTVNSWDALNQIINTYPQYEHMLRDNAVKQILVVSDDNSNPMTATQFNDQWVDLDPTHFGYTSHGIVSETNCLAAASIGSVYIELASNSGGIIGDLCDQDFQPVFDELAAAVVDNSIPCTYELPDAANGPQDAKTAEVFVDFGGGQEIVEPVENPDLCVEEEDNWFFDDPKTQRRSSSVRTPACGSSRARSRAWRFRSPARQLRTERPRLDVILLAGRAALQRIGRGTNRLNVAADAAALGNSWRA